MRGLGQASVATRTGVLELREEYEESREPTGYTTAHELHESKNLVPLLPHLSHELRNRIGSRSSITWGRLYCERTTHSGSTNAISQQIKK
jgi:hypothetical protein